MNEKSPLRSDDPRGLYPFNVLICTLSISDQRTYLSVLHAAHTTHHTAHHMCSKTQGYLSVLFHFQGIKKPFRFLRRALAMSSVSISPALAKALIGTAHHTAGHHCSFNSHGAKIEKFCISVKKKSCLLNPLSGLLSWKQKVKADVSFTR